MTFNDSKSSLTVPFETHFTFRVRILCCFSLAALLVCGCAHKKGSNSAQSSSLSTGKLIVTPDDALVGKVASVNQASSFVILNFPLGHLPAMQQRLNLYRQGFKVAEVRVTGPQYDDNVVADLLVGDPAVGDEARRE